MGNTILITEDEKVYRRVLCEYFTMLGFTVHAADNCRDTIRLAAQHLPDCFLFDYNLADENIAPACLFIRSHARLKDAPIIILSGAHEKAEECYNKCDADLFLERGKPLAEVGAAVKRQLRRAAAASGLITSPDLTLDAKNMRILRPGKPDLQLTAEQFRFFSLLVEKAPAFVSEEEVCRYVLMSELLPASRKAINMLAYRLRAKLGARLGRRIKSSRACGWIYIQPRDRRPSASATQKAVLAA